MHPSMYDLYVNSAGTMGGTPQAGPQSQMNPYAPESTANGNTSYFQQNSFQQPLQYHLYAPAGPHRENLLPYQRAANDFFMSAELREELQRKSAATIQTLPSLSR